MPEYLVEAYLSRADAPTAPGALGAGLRHVRSILVPDDEVCLHVMDAPSAEELRAALDRTALAYDRIVEVREVPPA